MTLTRKPKIDAKAVFLTVEELIEKGGSSTQKNKKKPPVSIKTQKSIVLRLPEDVLIAIDAILAQKSVPMSRNTWIVEAIVHRLKHENPSKNPLKVSEILA